jgi:hypothetical protein
MKYQKLLKCLNQSLIGYDRHVNSETWGFKVNFQGNNFLHQFSKTYITLVHIME